jgi:hypothetical protein
MLSSRGRREATRYPLPAPRDLPPVTPADAQAQNALGSGA